MPKAKVVRQSPSSTFREITILSVAAANVENRDERTRGGIRSVSMFAGIATGTFSSGAAETGVSGGVTLRLILNLRFPTDKNPPSGDCNTRRLLFRLDHMPETVKTLCQSSRCFVKRALAESRVRYQRRSASGRVTPCKRQGDADLREIATGSGSGRKVEVQVEVPVQEARNQLTGGVRSGPVVALPLLVSGWTDAIRDAQDRCEGNAQLRAAARATAKASRFSSVAPVASAIRRPSAADRVMASGQATSRGWPARPPRAPSGGCRDVGSCTTMGPGRYPSP